MPRISESPRGIPCLFPDFWVSLVAPELPGYMTGKTISHFKILDKLGGGGMGVVYLAEDTRLKRQVALKFLPPHLSTDRDAEQRFEQEAEAASALNHPNICTIHDIGQTDDGQLFIAMAHYEGETLKQKLAAGALPLDEALDIIEQLAEGLAVAHEKGIIHRDIKPANVLVTKRGRAVILDFGLAKLAGALDLTQSGSTLGTAHYMSPEQVQGEEVDHRTDIWSLGVLAFELLSGERPFRGDYEHAVIYSILNEAPRALSDGNANLPAPLEPIIARMLEKDKDRRYATADELLSDLRAIRGGSASQTIQVATDRPARKGFSLSARTWRFMAGLIVVLAVILVGVAIGSRWNSASDEAIPAVPTRVSESRIAVLPFTAPSSGDLADLEWQMADLLSISLNGIGDLESVDSNSLLGYMDQTGPIRDPNLAREIAEHFGAGRFILGSVNELGPQVRIVASLYDAEGGLDSRSQVSGIVNDLPTLVDSLTVGLIGTVVDEPLRGYVPVAAKTTRSVEALKAYLAGMHGMRSGNWDTAAPQFGLAVEIDSTFALGWARRTYMASGSPETVDSYRRHRHKLPPRERSLYDVISDDTSSVRERLRRFEQVTAKYPQYADALFHHADYLFHNGYAHGYFLQDSRPLFERALNYDPNNYEIIFHLPQLMALAGEFDTLDSLIVKYAEQLEARDDLFWVQILSAAGQNDDMRLRELIDNRGRFLWDVEVVRVALWLGDIPRALSWWNPDSLRNEWDPHIHGTGTGYFHYAAGQSRKADDVLTAVSDVAALGTWARTVYRTVGPMQAPTYELESLLARIRDWDTTKVRMQNFAKRDIFEGRYASVKSFLTGLVSLTLGDSALYSMSSKHLSETAARTGADRMELALANTLEAVRLWRLGDNLEALAVLSMADGIGDGQRLIASEYSGEGRLFGLIRYVRAEILFALGRHEEALRWYIALHETGWPTFVGLPFMGPSLLRQGEIHEILGNHEKARRAYTRFVELWDNADPYLQPYVQDARERIDALAIEDAREPAL